MQEWSNFAVATAGAAAALTGLIFVGLSLNLKTVMRYPGLVNRALVSLILLLCIMVVSVLLLVPQPVKPIGWETLLIGIFVWLAVTVIDAKSHRHTEVQYKRNFIRNIVFDQVALLPYIVCGTLVLLRGQSGLYWAVPAVVFSFMKAVFDAWVLLIEINR